MRESSLPRLPPVDRIATTSSTERCGARGAAEGGDATFPTARSSEVSVTRSGLLEEEHDLANLVGGEADVEAPVVEVHDVGEGLGCAVVEVRSAVGEPAIGCRRRGSSGTSCTCLE